jgi:hypothetical protein
MDITAPTRAAIVGNASAVTSVKGIESVGDYLFVTDNDYSSGAPRGMRIFDVSIPTNPSYVAHTYTIDGQFLSATGGYLYVADGPNFSRFGIANPTVPVDIGGSASMNSARGVACLGAYRLVADYGVGLKVLDDTNLLSITPVGLCPLSAARDVAARGNYAYVVDESDGLITVDVSEPASPRVVRRNALMGGTGKGIALGDGYVYLALGSAGLAIFDLTDPMSPSPRGTLTTVDACSLVVSGSYAYVADGTGGLAIVSVVDPDRPSLARRVATTDAHDVAVRGRYAYVADGTGGIQVVDLSPP